MALSARVRRELIKRGHGLKAELSLSAGEISEGVIGHVRAFLSGRELGKVRIRADSAAECEQAASELEAQVPCEVVSRVGRVLLLYRPAADVDRKTGSLE
jgi:RNA-binding protein YhbY